MNEALAKQDIVRLVMRSDAHARLARTASLMGRFLPKAIGILASGESEETKRRCRFVWDSYKSLDHSVTHSLRKELEQSHGLVVWGRFSHLLDAREDVVILRDVCRVSDVCTHPGFGEFKKVESIIERNNRKVAFFMKTGGMFVIDGRKPDFYEIEKYRLVAQGLGVVHVQDECLFHERNHLEFFSEFNSDNLLVYLSGRGVAQEDIRQLHRLFRAVEELYAYLGNAGQNRGEFILRAISFLEMRPPGYPHRVATEKFFEYFGCPLRDLTLPVESSTLMELMDRLDDIIRGDNARFLALQKGFGFPAFEKDIRSRIDVDSIERDLPYVTHLAESGGSFIRDRFPELNEIRDDLVNAGKQLIRDIGNFLRLIGGQMRQLEGLAG